MRVLLDEGLPVQLLEPLRLNLGHTFDHVDGMRWKGKKDPALFRDAASRGFDGIVSLDLDQLASPTEWKALRKSKLHHIGLRQGRRVQGKKGVARVIASLIAAMPYVLEELEAAHGQRIVEVVLLAASARHEIFDPTKGQKRYPYWH